MVLKEGGSVSPQVEPGGGVGTQSRSSFTLLIPNGSSVNYFKFLVFFIFVF